MAEFYQDGVEILNFIKKKRKILFDHNDYELLGMEIPLSVEIKDDTDVFLFNGFIDMVYMDKREGTVYIEDFNNYLCDIYFIFSSKTKDMHFQQSFERISNKIYLRDNSVLFDLSKDDEETKYTNEFKFISRDVKAKIKEKSPFNTHYELILHGLGNTIETNSDPKAEINEYYFPELLNIIKKRLYMMPLWSGVLVFKDGPIGRYESHFTNNPVEVSLHHKRYSTLQMSKKGELKLY